MAMSKGHVDAATGGAFLSLTIDNAIALIEKMVANQSWGRNTKLKKACIPEGDGLACRKIDLLMKRLDDCATEKETTTSTIQAMDSHMTCEVYRDIGHSGNNSPETHEEASYINNGFRQ
jgi:hypothetical protein